MNTNLRFKEFYPFILLITLLMTWALVAASNPPGAIAYSGDSKIKKSQRYYGEDRWSVANHYRLENQGQTALVN